METTQTENGFLPHRIAKLEAVTEVFSDTEHAVLVFLAVLHGDCFEVWAAQRSTYERCTEPRLFSSAAQARQYHEELVNDVCEYAFPEAAA